LAEKNSTYKSQLGWSTYKKFPRNFFVAMVMARELIFLLVINECRTIFGKKKGFKR
jgi:hypothetical protein